MASTASQNNAFELMATGEKSGQWGDITNVNLQIIDRATKGVGTITLSSTSYSLNTVDYTLSEGHYAALVFAGTPGGTCTVTINPNDQQKVFIVRNTTANSVVMTQGSGGNVTIAAGKSAIVYATGAGTGAAVVDVAPLLNVLQPTNNLSDVTNAATARTNLGLSIGTNVQAYDAGLQSIAGLTTSADQMVYTTGSDAYATASLTAFARTLLDDADAATARATLGLAIGTNVLAYDSNLQSFVTAFTLPTTDGTPSQLLQTNGSGTLSFVTPSVNTLSDGYSDGSSVGLGSGALASDDGTSNQNTALGLNAASQVTSQSSNVAVGANALRYGTHSNTVAVGASAAGNATTSYSVFVGRQAGENSGGSDNVGLGAQTLFSTTGSNNIGIGRAAGNSLTTGGNNIVIGTNANVSSATASNEITLGNSVHTVLRLPFTVTVSGLPSAATVGAGARSFVTDATVTTFASVVAGGGSNGVPVYSDGTNWRIG